MIDTSGLWPHQLKTFEFGKDLPSFISGCCPGTGKSYAQAKIAEYFLESGGSRILITCPKSLVRSAWQEEFTTRLPHIKIALAEAPEENRKAAFMSDSDVVIINHSYDAFKWMAKNESFLKRRLGKRALMINDESTAFKNPNSQTTKFAFKIAPLFEKRHCLSGTLAPNSVTELWAQAKLVDDGARLGKRYTAFRSLMQTSVQKGPFTQWVDKPDAANIAYGLLADILIRHKFEDVMKHVPRMDHRVIYYDLPKRHRTIYDKLEKELYLEFANKSISVVNAASLAAKLLQCASGAVYNDPDREDKSWSLIDSGRYDLIGDLVEERAHSIVFFLWKHQKAELIRQFEARGLPHDVIDGDVKSAEARDETRKRMQAGDLRVLLMHPKSGAHGLTLTKATTVIFASPTYQADWYVQGSARIRRGIQDQITESIIIVARDTRDEVAHQVFTGKKGRLDVLNTLFEGKT